MRRAVRRRILAFAGCSALVAMIVVVGTVCVFDVALPLAKLGQTSQQTIERVHCDESGVAAGVGGKKRCDISDFKNDWELDGADFLLVKGARFFVTSNPQYRGLWLNFSDPMFIGQFREPGTWETPTREVWRLYSERRKVGHRSVEIMVGQREKAEWELVDRPLPPDADRKLKEEVDRIASRVLASGDRIETRRINSRADGWQIVDAATGRVARWNGEIPAVFPRERALAADRIALYREGAELFVARADENDDLLAVSIFRVGNLWWLALAIGAVGALTFLLAYVVGVEWLRRYFALRGGRPPAVAEALRVGEGLTVEFKHGLTEDAVLRSVTAFANTNDGTIFIGIDDEGRVRGLDLPTVKARDEFRHRVFGLVRDRVQPCPAIELDFEEVDGAVVERLKAPFAIAPHHNLEELPRDTYVACWKPVCRTEEDGPTNDVNFFIFVGVSPDSLLQPAPHPPIELRRLGPNVTQEKRVRLRDRRSIHIAARDGMTPVITRALVGGTGRVLLGGQPWIRPGGVQALRWTQIGTLQGVRHPERNSAFKIETNQVLTVDQ